MTAAQPAQTGSDPTVLAAIGEEQPVVDRAYRRLDELRASTTARLVEVERGDHEDTPQARSARDALVTSYRARLRALHGVEERLVFGRLDTVHGRCHIGRLGLRDAAQDILLVDWRADAARGFYQATAADPGDVVARRHLRLRGRSVVGVHDDLLRAGARGPQVVDAGDAALLEVVQQPRTGRMHDIVATIQAEQDRIIRSPMTGVLVVHGAPGTGKTAVALHRVAYLLHRHRERLERSGVLLVGPSDRFLRYVEEVLPALGETSVVATTVSGLHAGVGVTAADPPAVAALKGSARMVPVLRRAVRSYQRVPDGPVRLEVEGGKVVLRPEAVAAARRTARASGEPHHVARVEFCRHVLDELTAQLVTAPEPNAGGAEDDGDGGDGAETDRVLQLLHASADVRREVNLCWLPRSAEQVLTRLWTDAAFLAACAPELDAGERELLLRQPSTDPGAGWSDADVPLLDELVALLGPLPATTAQARVRAQRESEERERIRFAEDSLAGLGLQEHLSAQVLADRFREAGTARTLAESAAADPSWAFGHVVVDEAQELSPMAWRAVFRRCPMRSMTIVGDVHQTSGPGAADWAAVLDEHAPGRWRQEELSVNYRTPGAVMDAARRVLCAAGRTVPPVRSLRAGEPPAVVHVEAITPERVVRMVEGLAAGWDSGTTAVVLPPAMVGRNPELSQAVSVLGPREAKGLEFDHVVVVEPAAFLDDGPGGASDLYVALTRATQQVVLVHSRPLPPALRA